MNDAVLERITGLKQISPEELIAKYSELLDG